MNERASAVVACLGLILCLCAHNLPFVLSTNRPTSALPLSPFSHLNPQYVLLHIPLGIRRPNPCNCVHKADLASASYAKSRPIWNISSSPHSASLYFPPPLAFSSRSLFSSVLSFHLADSSSGSPDELNIGRSQYGGGAAPLSGAGQNLGHS